MQTYELLVKNRAVVANSSDMTLVRTSIGIDQIHVLFDNAEWLDFPITVTFSQGEDSITQSLVISAIDDGDEWVAQSTCLIPHEVIDMNGPIKVTFQGTNSSGNHIITAAASPLSVEEAGDIDEGTAPSGAPTIDQWSQAYADALSVVNDAASVVDNLEGQLATIVSGAEQSVADIVETTRSPATTSELGVIKVGDGLSVTLDGTLSVSGGGTGGLTEAQAKLLSNLQRLAYYCFDTTFDANGDLEETAKVKMSALPFTVADEVTY